MNLVEGEWELVGWRRVASDGSVTYPFGEDVEGLLIYTASGLMMVQMTASKRPNIDTTDPLGGDAEARASAYSTCLAYFGRYEIHGEEVVHRVEASLYPNWSGRQETLSPHSRPETGNLRGDCFAVC